MNYKTSIFSRYWSLLRHCRLVFVHSLIILAFIIYNACLYMTHGICAWSYHTQGRFSFWTMVKSVNIMLEVNELYKHYIEILSNLNFEFFSSKFFFTHLFIYKNKFIIFQYKLYEKESYFLLHTLFLGPGRISMF